MGDLGQIILPSYMGEISLSQLASMRHDAGSPFNEVVETTCRGIPDPSAPPNSGIRLPCERQNRFQVRRYFETLTCCDECRAKADKLDWLERTKAYWEAICPEAFRKTDKDHPQFPKSQYAATKDYTGSQSLLLYGPSRAGKTRVAMLLLKRCLVRFNKRVAVCWEEDLESVKTFQDRKQLIARWGSYEVLLMDDALLASARDERTTSFLKQLIDYRLRYERHTLITSQVGGEDYMESAKRDGLIRSQDEARIKALLERVRESFRVVSFVEAKPKQEEQAF